MTRFVKSCVFFEATLNSIANFKSFYCLTLGFLLYYIFNICTIDPKSTLLAKNSYLLVIYLFPTLLAELGVAHAHICRKLDILYKDNKIFRPF